MASLDVSNIINEMLAYGSSARGRAVMGAHALLVEFELGDGEGHSFTLQGDVTNGAGQMVPRLKIQVKPEVLMEINAGEMSPQEAQIQGLIEMEGEIGLARLFQCNERTHQGENEEGVLTLYGQP